MLLNILCDVLDCLFLVPSLITFRCVVNLIQCISVVTLLEGFISCFDLLTCS